ncbi:MAG TPA: PQQ-dependent sugar dehydrogenase [Steroidobacteraceae bacterium]|nr:PQQ-dependent sugar dehydrogenase [Steroidobacteraceae bacterium]
MRVVRCLMLATAAFLALSPNSRAEAAESKAVTPAAGGAPASDAPLETRQRNAVDYQPAFPGQTRAKGIRNSVPYEVQIVTTALTLPWAVEQLPDGRLLVTEKPGNLRIVTLDGKLSPPVVGVPKVRYNGQAGLLDVALDPAFSRNHTIYFCYSEDRQGGSGVALARAQLVEDAQGAHLNDVKVIFRALPTIESDRQLGSRIAFGKDGKLYLALGERGVTEAVGQAQDLTSDFGKIARLNLDGSIPKDNPFVGRKDARPEIWTYGHRDPQSLAVDSATGKVWSIEHGPRGGDELNLIKRGANYGWPVICYGIDYPGGKIGAGLTQKAGMEQPVYYWDPVIAPSGMAIYDGAMFPEWKGSVFVGGLIGMKVVRLQMKGDKVAGEEWLLPDLRQRVRDVQQGNDGALYVVTDNGQLLRIFRKKGT